MPDEKDPRHDRALGMDQRISRRDYLNSTLLGSGAILAGSLCPLDLLASTAEDWNGYGGVGDYATSNGNTYEVMSDGHRIRDRAFEPLPAEIVDTGEQFDCVVVGGGISGLAAALFFKRRTGGKRACLVLENHAIFGGEARRNEFMVDGQRLIAHQGSAMFFPPLPASFLAEFYNSIGITAWQFPYQTWAGDSRPLAVARTPYFEGGKEGAFFFGAKFGQPKGQWVVDPWGTRLAGAPIPDPAKRELLSMQDAPAEPKPKMHGDALSRRLDSITLEQHLMEQYGLSRETIRTYLSPVAGGGSGLGADALSAYADYAADVLLPWDYAKGSQMFPGGNAGVARHIVKALIPDTFTGAPTLADICRSPVNFPALDRTGQDVRIRLRSTTIAVEKDRVIYLRGGKLYSVRARSVIMAGGSWTAKHIVRDLPALQRDAYAQFHRSPCLMANVAVRNWRFLYKLGITGCQWFEGIGNYTAVRKVATFGDVAPGISPDSPVVLTLKILFSSPGQPIESQVTQGRAELFATPFRDYERRIREQFTAMFSGSGFDPRRDIAGIILNRWGHAYLSPQPGFFFGVGDQPGPGDVLRNNPFGRIAFANSDVAGIMDHRSSILEANRAVNQVTES
jgi:spermidine dehydrogenase